MWLIYLFVSIAILVFLYVLFLIICAQMVDIRQEYNTDSRFYRALLNGATAIALWAIRIKVQISGLEKIPREGRLVFVSNHRSKFDPIITWYIFRKWQIAFLSKEENFHVPIFGRIIRKCCFMAIDRENPKEALKAINRAAGLLKQNAVSIGVYPEGTRSKSGGLLPFHNGVLKIAQKAQVPIVILAIDGTERIAKNFPFWKSTVYLDVIDVIPAETVCSTRSSVLGGQIWSKLENKLEERNTKG